MSSAIEELIDLIGRVSLEVETLCVRGLRSVDPSRLQWLQSTHESFAEMGAEYLARKLKSLIESIEGDGRGGSAALFDLMTTLRVSERRLTLQRAQVERDAVSDVDGLASVVWTVDQMRRMSARPWYSVFLATKTAWVLDPTLRSIW